MNITPNKAGSPGVFFATSTVMISRQRAVDNPACFAWDGDCVDTMQKMHEFYHLKLKAPITWLAAENMLEPYGATFKKWREEYGDEIGIYERGLSGTDSTTFGAWPQPWIAQLGITAPQHGNISWDKLPEDTQVKMMSYLKERYDKVFGQDTKLFFAANGDASTVRAMKRAGLQLFWGYNWNLNGDGVDNTGKGCLLWPFYINDVHAKATAPVGDTSIMAMHWGAMNVANAYTSSRMAKISLNDVCLNAHELANKTPSELVDRVGIDSRADFAERLIAEYAAQAQWNPYSLVPFQLEAEWMDEGGFGHAQNPHFNPANAEMFFHLGETAVRNGARLVTCEQFLDWHRERFDRTPEIVWYSEDVLKGVRIRGKDHDYPPMVVYGSHERQAIHMMSVGFNPVRSYSYIPVAQVEDPGLEYPFKREPNVELRVKEWTSPRCGIVLDGDGASYQLMEHDLTSWDQDEPDYSFMLWKANIPSYVELGDLVLSPNISKVKLLREKNLALVFASLKKGDNALWIKSTKPAEFIRIEEQRISGTRYEIYIRNDGPETGLCQIKMKLGFNLRIGGYWWDGRYYESVHYHGYNPYNWREDGELTINTTYPFTLPLRHGLTRCSIELLGKVIA